MMNVLSVNIFFGDDGCLSVDVVIGVVAMNVSVGAVDDGCCVSDCFCVW